MDIILFDFDYKIGGEIRDNSRTYKKINLMAQESFAEQLINTDKLKSNAFQVFIKKMNAAEKSVREHGFYSEKDVGKELTKI